MNITQDDYLDILFNDCGFGDRRRRNDFIGQRVGRPVRFLDELTTKEKSALIDELKARKQESASER